VGAVADESIEGLDERALAEIDQYSGYYDPTLEELSDGDET
jgi:hypothetical protein